MPAIFAEGLTKHFSGDIRAVDGIELDIAGGQIFGFLGANGSGKTTTVRMLTTLLRPTAGRAQVAGMDVERQASAVRRAIGVALQEVGLDDIQTGRELLQLQSRLYEVPARDIETRVEHLLDVVDLVDAADRRIKTYSGGMQRRLDLAAALVHGPKIVFLDEPTTGLDPISRESIWKYVSALNASEGVTFFLTTQYLEEADRLAHDVAIMDRGRIVAQGSPAALKASIGTDVVTVRVGEGDGMVERAVAAARRLEGIEDVRAFSESIVIYVREGSSAVARIVLLLDEADVPVREVTLAQPTLDDVFLRKTGHHLEADDAETRRAVGGQAQREGAT
jgi:ABC-2 type transport system ATP-binding protein